MIFVTYIDHIPVTLPCLLVPRIYSIRAGKLTSVGVSNPLENARKIEDKCFSESSNLSEFKSAIQSTLSKLTQALQEKAVRRFGHVFFNFSLFIIHHVYLS